MKLSFLHALALNLVLTTASLAQAAGPGSSALLRDQAAGRPLILGYGQGGLRARTIDGSWSHMLVAGAIDDAAYDPTLEVVYFRRGNELAALDLRLPNPKPVTLARGIGEFISPFVIQLSDERRVESDGRRGRFFMAALVLDASGQKTLEFGGFLASETYLRGIESGGDGARALHRSDFARVKVVGAAWLKKLADRARAAVTVVDTSDLDMGSTLPDAMFGCQQQKSAVGHKVVWGRQAGSAPGTIVNEYQCRRSVRFGDERHLLTVTRWSCGDRCYLGCVLYDTQTRQFALPTNPAEWKPEVVQNRDATCGPYHLLGDGKTYTDESSVCELGGTCRKLDLTPLGWLGVDGTAYVPAPIPR